MFKKEFRSKTDVTNCGYCNVSLKEENLENHCKTVHKKPKLVAGQRTLENIFKRHVQESSEPDLSPPSKKLNCEHEELDCDNVENLSKQIMHASNEKSVNFDNEKSNILRDESEMKENVLPKLNDLLSSFGGQDFPLIPSKIEEMSATLNASKAAV